MARNGQISVTMSTDLRNAAQEIREQKERQQELADALGITRMEFKRLEASLRKKQQADKTGAAATTKHAAAQTTMTGAAKASRVATMGATQALAAMGVTANAALGPIGMILAALTAVGGVTLGATSRMSALVDEVGLLAEGTGLSVRGMLAVRHAVASTGGDVNKTKEALASFSRVMKDELAGKSAPEVDAALRSTIARIESIDSPADRAAERMRIFGTESARALAGLTGGALDEAAAKTASLADKMERAGGSSSDMDAATTELRRALDELVVTVGDKLAPAVVETTGYLTGMADAVTYLTDSTAAQVVGWVNWGLTGGPILAGAEMAWNAVADAAANHEGTLDDVARSLIKVRTEYGNLHDELAELEAVYGGDGFVMAPAVMPGQTKADADAGREAKKRAQDRAKAQIDEARRVADEMDKMRRKIMSEQASQVGGLEAIDIRMALGIEEVYEWLDAVGRTPDTMALAEQRKAQIAQDAAGQREALRQQEAAQMAALEAQELAAADAAHAQRLSQIEQMAQAEQRLRDIRQDAALSAVTGFTQIVGAASASAEAIAMGRILETLAYGAAATARAFAELGPIAGFGAAAAMGGQLAMQIAAVKAAPSRHMGSMAPDEGMLRVRNGERVTVEPATTRPRRERKGGDGMTMLTIDNQAYRAMTRRSDRQDNIFGSRRRESVEVGR